MTSLFTPALSSLADLVPRDGLLAAEELESRPPLAILRREAAPGRVELTP